MRTKRSIFSVVALIIVALTAVGGVWYYETQQSQLVAGTQAVSTSSLGTTIPTGPSSPNAETSSATTLASSGIETATNASPQPNIKFRHPSGFSIPQYDAAVSRYAVLSSDEQEFIALVADPGVYPLGITEVGFGIYYDPTITTQAVCKSATTPGGDAVPMQPQNINGIVWYGGERVGVAAGTVSNITLYRTLHGGICYEADLVVDTCDGEGCGMIKSGKADQAMQDLKNIFSTVTFGQ